LYEFIYGCDETVCYYLKRNIKLNFIQKYEEYLKYYTLYTDELKKEKEFEREENQMKDAYEYLKSRNESYGILLNNLFKEKENIRREINEDENNNNNK
jgi:membrane-associated HD superfamily phosphohydrolase